MFRYTSPATLPAAYGEAGSTGSLRWWGRRGVPYIDPPEEVCTILRTPARRAASASRTVPTTLMVVST